MSLTREQASAIAENAVGTLVSLSRALAEACYRGEPVNPWRDNNLAGRWCLESYLRLTTGNAKLRAVLIAQGRLDACDADDHRACAEAHDALGRALFDFHTHEEDCRRYAEERADEADEADDRRERRRAV